MNCESDRVSGALNKRRVAFRESLLLLRPVGNLMVRVFTLEMFFGRSTSRRADMVPLTLIDDCPHAVV